MIFAKLTISAITVIGVYLFGYTCGVDDEKERQQKFSQKLLYNKYERR